MNGPLELPWLWAGAALVLAAALRAWAVPATTMRTGDPWPVRLLQGALVLIALGLALRWARLGHGPFLNLFEILASSLLSLGAVFLVASRRLPPLRATAPPVLALLGLMAAWLLRADPVDSFFPPTYETPVLWFHVLLGKLFLGCALCGLGVAGALLGRRRFARLGAGLPDDAALDTLAWRLMSVALLFETLMLIAGAVWAQDAWGRWWAWDPLESWAFLTWLLLAAAFHLRRSWRVSPRAGAWLIVAVFVLAFFTFFGVPFISTAPHKGAI